MKRILITGGNRGLGYATAEALTLLGHHVILTARSASAGEAAVEKIRGQVASSRVEFRVLDLASLASVRACAASLVGEPPLDVLFHNAGVMQQSPTRRMTSDRFEETLGTNVLGPFLLTQQLLPSLASKARVVCVSSRLHLPGSRGTPVHFDFDDPMLEHDYDPERAYKNSKLAMLWFAFELNRRLAPRGITVNGVCPGFVPVTAAESTHGFQRWLLRHVLVHLPFATSLRDAVRSFVFMATDPSLEGVGGQFFGECQPIASSPESKDEVKARRFWDFAAARVGA